MAEPPIERPVHAPLFDPDPADGSGAGGPSAGKGWGLWLGVVVVLAATAGAAVMLVPRTPREETVARRTAVKHYAELYRVSTESVDKYCRVRARRAAGGNWVVDVSRIVTPGSGGFHVTTTFNVGPDGKSRFVGRSDGRIE